MDIADPMSKFAAAWARVHDTAPSGYESDAATLATADAHGRPSARIVLVRGLDTNGFTFFTNYGSRKAHELDANPRAALCFYWFWLEQQVRVEGDIRKASAEASDTYFAGRPRGSQVGAWVSQQSEPLDSRAALEDRYHEIDASYGDRTVPRPPFWGGYLLVPDRIEFWHAAAYRLHDRHVYTRSGDGWQVQRLYP